MTPSPRIAAVVVLYHPGPEVLANILSWSGQVETIFAVDNSEGECSAVVADIEVLERVVLIRSGENEGIARALNIGADRAVAAGYDLLLTMDQDSSAAPDLVSRLLSCVAGRAHGRVGMISPFHLTKSEHRPGTEACEEVMTPMTSGCLLSLDAYKQVGPFRDDFFIDFVDNEYCLRLRRTGFPVLRVNNALLQHSVGDTHKFGPFIATNHSPLRRYYKTRNRLQVFKEYVGIFPGHCLFDLVRLAKEITSIILFEEKKTEKLRMIWRGWRDFCRGKFGKFSEA